MAGDGLVMNGNDMVVRRDFPKVRRLNDGSLLGVAGNEPAAFAMAGWLNGGEKPSLDDVEALQLMPDGELRYYHNGNGPSPAEAPAVLGTGGKLAMGAMLAGATPKEAVKIACSRDICSGGEIISMERGPA
jgi:hypothetical protein